MFAYSVLIYSVFAYSVFAYSVFAYSVFAYSVFAYSVFTYSVFAYSVFAYSVFAYSMLRLFCIRLFHIRLFRIGLFRIYLFRVRHLQPIKLQITSIIFSAFNLQRASKVHNFGKRCTMFICTSCLECGCLESWFILCTYNLFPSQLLTKDTKYFHDLTRITSPLTQRYYIPR